MRNLYHELIRYGYQGSHTNTVLNAVRRSTGKEQTMDKLIEEIINYLIDNKLTIRATADESLIITDQKTGEEIIIKDLGYPI